MTAQVVPPSFPGKPGNGGFDAPGQPPFVARFLTYGEPLRAANQDPQTTATAAPRPMEPPAPQSQSLADINPPPLPQAYLALRRAIENPMATPASVATVISMDPGLAAYILRLANSPLYSPTTRVETISRAVSLIGLGEIETMAAGSVLRRLTEQPPRPDLLDLDDFWRHAVAVGMLARALAERVGERGGERFFVAGLLHDVGRLVLAVAEPDLAAMTLGRAGASRVSIDAAERLELGFDHASLAGRISEKWRLPEHLTIAVAGHHQPSQCPDSLLAAAVHAADFMANALGVRAMPAAGLPRLDPQVLAAFNLEQANPVEFQELLVSGLAAMTALVAP
jgi:HD-like signal output (HDOD) protein